MSDNTAAPVDATLTEDERLALVPAVHCGVHPTVVAVERILSQRAATAKELRARVHRVYLYALDRRTHFANEGNEINAARAVAYQSVAGQLLRALEASDG